MEASTVLIRLPANTRLSMLGLSVMGMMSRSAVLGHEADRKASSHVQACGQKPLAAVAKRQTTTAAVVNAECLDAPMLDGGGCSRSRARVASETLALHTRYAVPFLLNVTWLLSAICSHANAGDEVVRAARSPSLASACLAASLLRMGVTGAIYSVPSFFPSAAGSKLSVIG